MQLFDFDYITESSSTDSEGHTHETDTHHHFTCGVLTIAATCPPMSIGHEGFFSRLGEHMGVHDVALESEAFNREFRVKCDDKRFAFALLDANMQEWLLAAAKTVPAVELNGPFVLLATKQMKIPEWPSLLEWFDQFVAHVPNVVSTTYPPDSRRGE